MAQDLDGFSSGDVSSIDITIGVDTFTLENVSLKRNSTVVRQYDKDGEPKNKAIIPKETTGTATAQYDNDPPSIGDEFSHTFDSGNGSETFIIVDVGDERAIDTAKKIPITFEKKIN